MELRVWTLGLRVWSLGLRAPVTSILGSGFYIPYSYMYHLGYGKGLGHCVVDRNVIAQELRVRGV